MPHFVKQALSQEGATEQLPPPENFKNLVAALSRGMLTCKCSEKSFDVNFVIDWLVGLRIVVLSNVVHDTSRLLQTNEIMTETGV